MGTRGSQLTAGSQAPVDFQGSQASRATVGFRVSLATQATVVRDCRAFLDLVDWTGSLLRVVIRDTVVNRGIQDFHLPAGLVVSVVRESVGTLASVESQGIRGSLEREQADSLASVAAQATRDIQGSLVIADSVRSQVTRDSVDLLG